MNNGNAGKILCRDQNYLVKFYFIRRQTNKSGQRIWRLNKCIDTGNWQFIPVYRLSCFP